MQAVVPAATVDPDITPSSSYEIIGFVWGNMLDSDIGYFTMPADLECGDEYEYPEPWAFQVNGQPTMCNMVRGRLSKRNAFIPASNLHRPMEDPYRFVRYQK